MLIPREPMAPETKEEEDAAPREPMAPETTKEEAAGSLCALLVRHRLSSLVVIDGSRLQAGQVLESVPMTTLG